MELPLSELGIVGASIAAMVWIVRAFLSHLKEKDTKFTETINNHLAHSIKTQERLVNAVEKLHDKL